MIRKRLHTIWFTGSVVRWPSGSRRWKHCARAFMDIYRDFKELLESFNAHRVEERFRVSPDYTCRIQTFNGCSVSKPISWTMASCGPRS